MKSTLLPLMLLASMLISSAAHSAEKAISKQQAINIVQKQHPGRVLSVKQKNSHYTIKILDNKGNIRLIRVDSGEGKIIRNH